MFAAIRAPRALHREFRSAIDFEARTPTAFDHRRLCCDARDVAQAQGARFARRSTPAIGSAPCRVGRRGGERLGPVIGTLNEGLLHAQLKAWDRRPGDLVEHPVDGYVVDLVRGGTLVEIQTGGLAPLRRKLECLLDRHAVRLVVPVALTRRIVRLSGDGEYPSGRRSPRRGSPQDVFARLVSLPALLARPAFELELLLTHESEHRRHEPGRAFRRHGWVVAGRSLVSVEQSLVLRTP